jgi:hypothetical protein
VDNGYPQGGYLSPEAILAAQDLPEADVDVPEWGGRVRVRGLTMGEVLAIRKAVGDDERLVVVHTLATAFVHPAMTVDQAEALMGKSGAVAQRVLVTINSLNGVGPNGQAGVVAAQRQFPDEPGNPAGPGTGQGAGADAG